jgi:hypothetical protein
MTFTRIAIACAAPVALSLGALSVPAQAQTATASAAFERAMLGEMDDATRAAVTARATGGNTVAAVIGTILINNYEAAGAKHPGHPLTIVAIDYARGVAVLGYDEDTDEVVNFDPKTLRLTAEAAADAAADDAEAVADVEDDGEDDSDD